MDKQVRIVKLRQSGLKARIVVLPKGEIEFIAGYIFAPSKHAYYTQIIYYFCENFLTGIVPQMVGKDKSDREKVFEELYRAICEYNPEVERCWRPVSNKREGNIMQVTVKVEPEERKAKVTRKPRINKTKVKTLSKYLNSVVFGQEEAIQKIQEFFEMAMTGLNDPERPRGSFMFIGDTGTGKTLCSKEIAKHFFGKDWKNGIYIINGSEYMEEHESAKLLGSPQGYVGYDEGSPFFKHIQKNPECIVLVDEFEKAHPRIQDVFLQILDEGTAYDNKGKEVDFTKTFVIFTSNIGTKEIYHKNPIGFIDKKENRDIEVAVNSALGKFCRIEFLKRFDGVVVFNKLNHDHHKRIVNTELTKIAERLLEKVIDLEYDEEVLSHLAALVSEDDSGRDVNLVVKSEVTSKISRMLMGESDFSSFVVEVTENGLQTRGVKVGKTKNTEEGKPS